MTGTFELVETRRGDFEFRLLSYSGKILAVSGTYSDKDSAVAAIRLARESAAMALIQDHTTRAPHPTTPSKTKSRHDNAIEDKVPARPRGAVAMVRMKRAGT